MSDHSYGRNRDSMADIELSLNNAFAEHPKATISEDGTPSIPADALADVFRSLAATFGGVELMSEDEMQMLQALVVANPGIEVTPQLTLGFIAAKTKHSTPPHTPDALDNDEEMQVEDELRGRGEGRDYDARSRSSSRDSVGTHRNHSRPPSRGGPQTPVSAASPFDTSRRQRSTPLGGTAPSSWASQKRPPHHRRKSDAGSRSDSESSAGPSAYGNRPGGRSRAPSNPTSPSMDSSFSIGSPPMGARSRPPSRGGNHRFDDADEYDFTLRQGLNSLPMPHANDDGSDSDDEHAGDMVIPRSTTSSNVSLMPDEQMEALQRANADLMRKLAETERLMQRKLAEHEAEFEDLQFTLEETRNELSAAKREEKELRGKERSTAAQIAALEADVVKVSKQLETSKATYNNLHRQYADQLASTQKYREDLRERDDVARTLREQAALSNIEIQRYIKEAEAYEDRIAHLEQELVVANQAHVQLDEQKQENMLLKETIDRMRYDLDEMRSNSAILGGTPSGQSSAPSSISKSLGAELLGKMKGWGGMDGESENEDDEDDDSSTPKEDEDTEGEDVIQTIITRKKRKVTSRANKIETRTFEEVKDYSDTGTQYEPELFFVSGGSQTEKVLTASTIIQTEPTMEQPPAPPADTAEMEIQTEPEEVKAAPVIPGPSSVPIDAPPAYVAKI
ncbi:unnamed protein product [Mycena citricolor]|uniref:Uncharacterized protein n=1 Tax=Mycena citricolor TaxID=2018698 RepID=A0AAD2H5M9_9AGAR|nr:unnamed protein product [Mycena citricolor]